MPTVTTYSPLIPPERPSKTRPNRRSSVLGSGVTALNFSVAEDLRTMSLSPPLTPKSPNGAKQSKFSSYRLRSNSSLASHANDDVLKQYTDYLPNGTARGSPYGLGMTGSQDWTSETRRSSVAMSDTGSVDMPIPSFLGREAFDMVMKNPETATKLWKFAVSQGCGQYIEFLMKIRDYTESLEQVVAQVSTISSSYTSVTATSPISLPAQVSKSLNMNIKHLVSSMIPSLDTLFLESRACVEQKIIEEVFPNFVKQQLALCTSMSLALEVDARTPPIDFPGLRGAFCLSDPAKAGNPIVFTSDSFEQLTGYGRYEVISRGCGFMQGPHTDRDTTMRMRQAVLTNQETVELVLNYRRDGQPFWNMLYMCPLLDAGGRPRLYMGAQIDVSASITDAKDVIKLLNYNPDTALAVKDQDSSLERGRDTRADVEREESFQTRASSRKSFFRSFKKQPNSPPPSPLPSPDRSDSPTNGGLDKNITTRTILTGLPGPTDLLHTPYSRFMLLEHISAYPSQTERESVMSKKTPPKLHISYCSQGLIDILGLGMAADAIIHKDVFDVLAEQANSPSVTKAFKSTVRETVLGDGRSASMEMAIVRASAWKPAISWLAPGGEDANTRERKAGKGDASSTARSRLGKMMTYWTPLKDAEDEVRYVMLVLSPMSVRE